MNGSMKDTLERRARRTVGWIRENPFAVWTGALVLAILLLAYWIFWFPNPIPADNGVVVYVPRGASFRSALDSLESKGALRSRWAIRIAGRMLGYDERVYVGKYRFREGASNSDILEGLHFGTARETEKLAIPEGWRYVYVAARTARVLGVDSSTVAGLCRDTAFIRSLGIDAPTLEGYLMPDTYEFHWQTPEREIVSRLAESFLAFYVDSLDERRRQLRMSLNQVLTLASIVEGESNLDEERARIAGVYWNRLRKGMRLEADPTVQYIIEDGPRRLTYQDLRINSPYNTYRRTGLPPGPINNPGRASIIAALYPERHQYHFFVATGTGGHNFSRTYAEHLRNVRDYRRVRRMQQQATTP